MRENFRRNSPSAFFRLFLSYVVLLISPCACFEVEVSLLAGYYVDACLIIAIAAVVDFTVCSYDELGLPPVVAYADAQLLHYRQ